MRGQSLLAGLGLASLLVGCGGGSDTPAGPTGGGTSGNAVNVGNNFYSPTDVNVTEGTTVTWTWAAGAAQHSVTFDDGPDSGVHTAGATFPRTFSTAGTFRYHCVIHPTLMIGTVTVTAAGTGTTGGTGGTGGSGMGGGGTGGYP